MEFLLVLLLKPLFIPAFLLLAACIKWCIWRFLPDGWIKYWLLRPIVQ